tara:strand:+ start:1540 stop:3198 length:1659 start_codon:yes stop_codon:yes gene_type:complete
MAIENDFSVAVNGDIRYTGTTANYTVLELHRFLQDLADDASSSGDDLLDITNINPSLRSTDQIITLNAPYNIDDSTAEHIYGGSITQSGGDVIYSGLQVIGSVFSPSTELQIVQNNTLLTNYWSTGLNTSDGSLLRIVVKSRTGGADIDGKRIRVQARELGDTYAEFEVTLGQGESVAAISTQQDLNNQTAAGTIATWNTITNVEGYQLIDLNNGNGPQPYYSQWNIGSQSLNELYERTKWIQRRGTSQTIHGINGELFRGITHSFAYDNESSGPFQEDEIISWGTGLTSGTGLLLALDDNGATRNMYIQLLTGVVPVNNITVTGNNTSATADVDGSVTARTISTAFIGTSTGTNIIGAYGIGIEASDINASDTLFDLNNTQQVPPNNQTFTVTNLVASEDRVLVTANDGADEVDYDQFSLNTTLSGAAETSVVVTTTIPTDTPNAGTIRVQTDSGIYKLITYTSYTGSTFTINSSDFSSDNATASNNVFISYIDETASSTTASYTAVYATDRSLLVNVRNGTGTIKIVPFKTPSTFGSAGGSVSTIRNPDV